MTDSSHLASTVELPARDSATLDLSELKRAEAELLASRRALDLLASVSHQLAERELEEPEAFDDVAREVAALFGDYCAVRLLSSDGNWLELRGHHQQDGHSRELIQTGVRSAEQDGVRVLASRVLRTSSPDGRVSLGDAGEAIEPLAGTLTVPIALHGKLLGTLSVGRKQSANYTTEEERLLNDVADRMAVAITLAEQRRELVAERKRLRATIEHARYTNAQLVKASEVLSQSLDYERTLDGVLSLMVPAYGDFAVFDLREGDGVRRLARAPNHERIELALRNLEWPPAQCPVNVSALESGRSAMHTQIDDAWLARVAPDPALRAALRELGFRSLITVPLFSQGSTLGALTLFFAGSGRTHNEDDLTLAEETARRAATAIVNARLFKEAQEAIGVRDDFLSMAGHELRTPLTALQLQILSITKMVGQPDFADKVATRAEKAGRNVLRLSSLVNELLDISRISAGRLRLERTPFDLTEVVRSVLARHDEDLRKNGCSLELVSSDTLHGAWDRARVEQIVTNLITNAIKYGKGKPIAVQVERSENGARIVVQDHGMGIPPEDQQRIFQRFERAVSSRHFGGLGLGLWIARQLVDAHGGTIRVTSESGLGARFEVELPLVPPDEVLT